MKSIIDTYKKKLYDYLQLTDSEPVVRERINNEFIDIVFHTDVKNIMSSVIAMAVIYCTLMFFDVNWKLHAWIIFGYGYYFVRYAILQFSRKGEFLGIKAKNIRLTDAQVMLHGATLGGHASVLYLIVSFPPYTALSELITIMGVLVFLTAALSLNSNLPLWCFFFTTSMILPIALIMVSKGGFFIMTGIIIGYYGFFIFSMNLRYYKLYYDSSLFQYQNKIYIPFADHFAHEIT